MSSKTTLTSLHVQINDLAALYAAMTVRLDAIVASAAAPATKQKKTRVKNPDAPKRAPGAYVVFCQAERAKTPELKLTLTQLGERWRLLSDDQKASFKNAPVPVVAAPVPVVAKPVVPKPTTEQLLVAAGLKSGTPVADKYLRFCAGAPEMDAATLAKRWKALSPEQKAKYNDAPDSDSDVSDGHDDDDSDDE